MNNPENRERDNESISLILKYLFGWLKENGIFNSYYGKVIKEDKHLVYVLFILFINLTLFLYSIDQAQTRMYNEEKLLHENKELKEEIDFLKSKHTSKELIDFEKEIEKLREENNEQK